MPWGADDNDRICEAIGYVPLADSQAVVQAKMDLIVSEPAIARIQTYLNEIAIIKTAESSEINIQASQALDQLREQGNHLCELVSRAIGLPITDGQELFL